MPVCEVFLHARFHKWDFQYKVEFKQSIRVFKFFLRSGWWGWGEGGDDLLEIREKVLIAFLDFNRFPFPFFEL
jgi:hypothetical protein